MDKQEFDGWMRVTQDSETRWTMDEVQWANRRRVLCYKGGEDGVYIECEPDGTATIGTYAGAIPHIGEALFVPKHSKKMGANASDAFAAVAQKLGVGFLTNLIGAR